MGLITLATKKWCGIFGLIIVANAVAFTQSSNAQEEFVSVCDRGAAVRAAIELGLLRSCREIKKQDLLELDRLSNETEFVEQKILTRSDLSDLSHLRMISLNGVGLEQIEECAFCGLRNQVNIDLSENALTKIDPNWFSAENRITSFSIRENPLKQIHRNDFLNLKNVLSLNLSACELSALPPDIFFDLKSLLEVSVNKNHFVEIDEDLFIQNRSLENVNLSDNKLRLIPKGLFNGLANLVYFDISLNPVVELEVGLLDGLDSLEWIFLGSGQLEKIPDDFFISAKKLWRVEFLVASPLSQTNRAAFRGLSIQPLGLPVGFADSTSSRIEGGTWD